MSGGSLAYCVLQSSMELIDIVSKIKSLGLIAILRETRYALDIHEKDILKFFCSKRKYLSTEI